MDLIICNDLTAKVNGVLCYLLVNIYITMQISTMFFTENTLYMSMVISSVANRITLPVD